MTQTARPREPDHPTNDTDPDDRPDWWLVLLTSGVCVAATVAAVVLTFMF
ncbi:MAG: hypothetical protein ACRD2C_18990 [Acidimicrobiales bacterium]